MYKNNTISDYLNALASKAPAPGGGSVAALIGAIACATLGKVVNFTVGKEKYKAHEEEMTEILNRLERFREEFNELSAEDAKVYGKLSAAFKLPRDEKRDKLVQAALKEATAVPLAACGKSREAIEMCLPVAKKGNANLITDTGIASLLFKCAFNSAVLNVEINLKSIKDETFVRETKATLDSTEKEIGVIDQKIISVMKEKMK